MLNLCCDEPPKSVRICGADYPVHTDFFVWVKVMSLFRKLDATGDEIAAQNNAVAIAEIVSIAFLEPEKVVQNCSANDILTAVEKFSKGYERPKAESVAANGVEERDVINFEYDLNYIILAIRNQSGIDLSYRRKEPFHWWLFLLEFETLNVNHYISRLMSRRAYTGKDKDLIALRESSKIPEEFTKTRTEEREGDIFNSYFT